MNKSDNIDQLAAALVAAQKELQAIPMNATNPFLKNRYADLGAVIEAAREPLGKHGLAISQMPYTGDGGAIGVTTILMHTSGQWISSSIELMAGEEKGKSLAQVAGSIITYLRRYAFAAMISGYADEDTDGEPAERKVLPSSGEIARERLKKELEKEEAPVKKSSEPVNPAADHPYGNFVLAWPQAKKITQKEKPTLQDIYACGPAGLNYLQWVLKTPPKADADERMKQRVLDTQEAVRGFLESVQSNQTVNRQTGEVVEQMVKKAEEIKETKKPVKEFQILSRNWNQWIKQVGMEMPFYMENGSPNSGLILSVLKGMGYEKFTDDDADELIGVLRVHVAEVETQKEAIFGTEPTQGTFS